MIQDPCGNIPFIFCFFHFNFFEVVIIYYINIYQKTWKYIPKNPYYFHEKNKPQDLEILGLDVIQGTENQYDFVVKIFNGNEKWVVRSAVAQLVNNNEVIAEKNFLVYPSEVKYVIFFNQAEANPNSSQIRIAKVGWRHYLKFADFAASRLDFEISEIEFKSPRDLNLGGKLPVSLLTFKIKNNTPYDYWQVGLYMVLLSSQKVGGANYLALEKFLSGQTRPVEMRWYESLPPVYEIEIIPEVDILNSASYMPPQP